MRKHSLVTLRGYDRNKLGIQFKDVVYAYKEFDTGTYLDMLSVPYLSYVIFVVESLAKTNMNMFYLAHFLPEGWKCMK